MSAYTRTSRPADALRDIRITPDFLPHADGSALIEYGNRPSEVSAQPFQTAYLIVECMKF